MPSSARLPTMPRLARRQSHGPVRLPGHRRRRLPMRRSVFPTTASSRVLVGSGMGAGRSVAFATPGALWKTIGRGFHQALLDARTVVAVLGDRVIRVVDVPELLKREYVYLAVR